MKSSPLLHLTLAMLAAGAGGLLPAGCVPGGDEPLTGHPDGNPPGPPPEDRPPPQVEPGPAAPLISAVAVSAVTRHEALLTFTTSAPALAVVDYDLSAWPKRAAEDVPATRHAVLLQHLLSGEEHRFRITVTDGDGRRTVDEERGLLTAADARGALPGGWASSDIGAVSDSLPGAAWFDGDVDGGSFTVRGTGTDVYNEADSFRFVYLPISGDFQLTLKVDSWSGYLHMWSKAMTMFRARLTPGSPMFNQSLNFSGLDYLYYRDAEDAHHKDITEGQLNPGEGTPLWARLRRVGDTFTESYSEDGVTWRVNGPQAGTRVPLPSKGYVGFGVCSKSNSFLSEIVYSHVSLKRL